MAGKKRFSKHEFLASAQGYLPPGAQVRETDAHGQPAAPARLADLSENVFYRFDAEALAALGHAIEDLALEDANGNLLTACQDFQQFESQRELYCHLAVTIDRVEVLAAGALPRRARRIQFVKDGQGACQNFWLVLYEGRHHQALVMGQQVNRARTFEEKQFAGFYTFNSGLIKRIRREVLELAGGHCPALREFARQQAIDQAAKQLKSDFLRQKAALDQAVRRLQLDGERYRAGHFASDLEKELSRLHQWKTRMPEILARVESRQGA